MKRNPQTILTILAGLCFLTACKNDPTLFKKNDQSKDPSAKVTFYNANLQVKPAFKGLDHAFKKFIVNSEKESTIYIAETGTEIKIPAHAFVDEKGQTIKGQVEIKYREFHDAAEIMLSGIPMYNPDNGSYMVSAGMYEIRGSQKGKTIEIDPEKKVAISMASYREGDDYDFFVLGDKNGRWKTLSENDKPRVNLKRANAIDKLNRTPIEKPVEPVKLGSSKEFVFNFNVEKSAFPDLAVFNDVLWQFAGNETDADHPEKNQKMFNSTWNQVKLVAGQDCYQIKMSNSKDSFITRVKPLLKGKDFEKAKKQFDSKLATYEKVKKAVEDQRMVFENQAQLNRSFEIGGFGVYNCDIWQNMPMTEPMVTEIEFPEGFEHLSAMKHTCYLINKSRSTVVPISSEKFKGLSLPKVDEFFMLVVLPENKVGYMDSKAYSNIVNQKQKKATIKIKISDTKVVGLDDLKKIMSSFS